MLILLNQFNVRLNITCFFAAINQHSVRPGATGILCFGHRMTIPMDFKAKVDTQLTELFVHMHVIMIPRVISRPNYLLHTEQELYRQAKPAHYETLILNHNKVHES